MKKLGSLFLSAFALAAFIQTGCSDNKPAESTNDATAAVVEKPNYGGYASQAEWGHHLVVVGGCGDCHTPKKMTPMGPVDDTSLLLSGHPQDAPAPKVDRKKMESEGLVVTQDFTSWIGPWGITYSANLTPDPTGTGNWTEEQFVYAITHLVSKGLPGYRPLLPPMALMPVIHYSDEEKKAIFAYLRTIKPVKNVSVQPTPPVLPPKQ